MDHLRVTVVGGGKAGDTNRQEKPWRWLLTLALVLCPVFPAGALHGQEMALPAENQWSLFDRILGFDRNLEERTEDGMVIGVFYQSRYRVSASARGELVQAAQGASGRILDLEHVRLVSLEANSEEEMRRRLEEEGVDLLYVTPLRAQEASEIAEVATGLRIPTLTGVPEYMAEGICLGLGLRGGRPEILVNLPVCRSVGMDLNSELLKLATVVGSGPGSRD